MNRPWERLPALFGGREPRSWFDVRRIDDRTFAIREPRYWQRNVNHLILGSARALLFDTGSGLSDISAVTAQLTPLPVTALASHLHWDHIGGHRRFRTVAVPDLDVVSDQLVAGVVRTRVQKTLTLRPRTLHVTELIRPGAAIDLGDRLLQVHHAPGHTPDSVALYDPQRGYLFTGDFLYDGPLVFGVLPGSDLTAAGLTADRLVRDCPADTVFGAHYGPVPAIALRSLADGLRGIDNGSVTGTRRVLRRYEFGGVIVVTR